MRMKGQYRKEEEGRKKKRCWKKMRKEKPRRRNFRLGNQVRRIHFGVPLPLSGER